MLSKAMEAAINDQINKEFYSAYVYLAMAAHFESLSLSGFAHWMRLQSQEEVAHAMKLFEHMIDRGGRVRLTAIEEPKGDYSSPLEVFEQALEHEREVTRMIHSLYALAAEENDYAAQVALQWFITEQVEEEKSAGEVVDQLKMAGDNRTALLLLDRQLGARSSVE